MMRRIVCMLMGCLLCWMMGGALWGADNSRLVDSLLHRVDSLPPGMERMEVMRKLVRATQMTPKGIDYARRMLHEAEALHHDSLTAYSTTLIANHLFAQKERNIDSLRYWVNYGLPIAKRCRYWNMYFLLHKTMVQTYLYAEHYEHALRAAEEMLREAQAVGNADGQLIAYSCIANSYQSTKRFKETHEALLHAYSLFDQPLQTANKITILKQILYFLDVVHRYEEMQPYLEQMEKELHHLLETHPLMANALNDYFMMLECFSVQYYSHSENKKLAEEHIRKAQNYKKRLNFESYYLIYANALTTYYVLCDDYDRALALNDSALARMTRNGSKGSRYIYYLEQRAGILYTKGDYEAALDIYRKAKVKIDSISHIISDAQIEEIRELYRLDELQIEHEAHERQMLKVVLWMLGLMIGVSLLGLLHRGFVQQRLHKSKQALQTAKRITEKANEDKRRFLSTMSHAIRVPLNAVVGFSQILATSDALTDEQREEYGEIVQHNTEKLLFLVNSILDLSRLEAGMTKWKLTDGDLMQVCRDALNSVRLSHPDWQIEADIPEEIFLGHADTARLMQVVSSMLAGVVTTPLKADERPSLRVHVADSLLQGVVENSPLADPERKTQESGLRHDINRMTLHFFGGSYQVDEVKGSIHFSIRGC